MAVNRFTGLTNSNWGTSTNWSTLAVPTSGDGNVATFDGTSPACTVDTSARACNNIDFTGYTNTITMTNNISVSGNITLGFGAGGGATGAGLLQATAAGTLTSSGSTWNGTLKLNSSATFTLADNWTVVKLQPGTGASAIVVNGFKINVTTDLDISSISTGSCSGTTEFVMTGTGSIIYPTSTGFIKNSLTINTAGTVTFSTGTFRYNTGTLTYTAGTISGATNCDLVVVLSTTFNTGGSVMTFKSITFSGSTLTMTINSDLYTAGDLLLQSTTTTAMTLTGSSIYVSGNCTITSTTTGTYAGTTIVGLVGTGTLSWASATTGRYLAPIRINTSGTITISTPMYMDLAKFTYTTGTVITDTTWSSNVAGSRAAISIGG